MKIAFHIARMNYYRVMAPLIDAALGRGHDVVCWHHSGATALGQNRPSKDRLPMFRNGVPAVVEYMQPEQIVDIISHGDASVIIDLSPPKYEGVQKRNKRGIGKASWYVLDLPPVDCIGCEILSPEQVLGCDGFLISSSYYLSAIKRIVSQDKGALLQYTLEHRHQVGLQAHDWVKKNFMFRWEARHLEHLEKNSHVVGNVALDALAITNPDIIRKRWGIPQGKKIIAHLPFPFGWDFSAPWEQLFCRHSLWSRLYWMFQYRRFDQLSKVVSSTSNLDAVRSLKSFAAQNNAWLVAKLRHSREAAVEIKKYCDLVVGEEGYYPHTALELFSIADLVAGFYSFGAVEALAVGKPYLNIEVPGFPFYYFCEARTDIKTCDPFKGAVWSYDMQKMRHCLPSDRLGYFMIEPKARVEYLAKFAGWPIGGASDKVLDIIENIN